MLTEWQSTVLKLCAHGIKMSCFIKNMINHSIALSNSSNPYSRTLQLLLYRFMMNFIIHDCGTVINWIIIAIISYNVVNCSMCQNELKIHYSDSKMHCLFCFQVKCILWDSIPVSLKRNNTTLLFIFIFIYLLMLYSTSAEGLQDSWSYSLFKDVK